jgi:hypothetical protein
MPRLKILTSLTLFALLLMLTPALAQEEARPPQFLYRDGERLLLVTVQGDTAETLTLPGIEIGEGDRFEWSPDGRYLLALLDEGGDWGRKCLNLYDVDAQRWLFDAPVACDADEAVFSHNGRWIAYAINDTETTGNGMLWLYDIIQAIDVKLWTTTEGSHVHWAGISNLEWSPNDECLTFTAWKNMGGGGRASLGIYCMETSQLHIVVGGDGYYATYDPIWSFDDEWILLVLQEEYHGIGLSETNHQGDLYLIHAIDGQSYRLTYTPAEPELNVGWTEDGEIAFDVVHSVRLSINNAMQISAPSLESIETPAPPTPLRPLGSLPAPNSPYEVRIDNDVLSITNVENRVRGDLFTDPLPENYSYFTVIIGWRPTGE